MRGKLLSLERTFLSHTEKVKELDLVFLKELQRRIVNVKKVSRKSKWKGFFLYQRYMKLWWGCFFFFSSTLEPPTGEWNHPRFGFTSHLFIFSFWGLLFEMLEAVDTACLEGQSVCYMCVLYGLRKCVTFFNCSEKSGRTVTDIIQSIIWCGWKTTQEMAWRRKITCWMFSVVLWCEGKGPGY